MIENDRKIISLIVQNMIKFDSWDLPKAKKDSKKCLIYPIFEKLSDLTDDEFWQEKILNCSRGKMPKSSYRFNEDTNILEYNKGKRTTKVLLEEDNLQNSLDDLIDFFKKTENIFSAADDKEKIEEPEDIYMTWGKSKKQTKFVLLIDYTNYLKKELSLNEDEYKQLLKTISLGMEWKCFTSKNVEMEDNKITFIKGIRRNNQGRFFLDDDLKNIFMNRKEKKDKLVRKPKKVTPKNNIKLKCESDYTTHLINHFNRIYL